MKIIEKKTYKILVIILILTAIYVLCYFFYPKSYNSIVADGGTRIYEARMYTLVHWQEMDHMLQLGDEKVLRWSGRKGWKIYWYPNQDAWQELEPMNMEGFPWDEFYEWKEKHPEWDG